MKELARRELSRRRLKYFMKYTMPNFELEKFHEELFEALEEVERGELKRLMVFLPPRAGKACEVNTPIPTPNGWKAINELQIGDYVFNEKGEQVKVIAKSQIWKDREMYEVFTKTGHSIIVDESHEWLARLCRKSNKFKKYETKELAKRTSLRKPLIHHHTGLMLTAKKLLIDPYVLGYWLGDGSSYYSAISSGSNDIDYARSEVEAAGYKTKLYSTGNQFGISGLTALLKKYNLFKNKHIPHDYLRASESQRIALLQGLIDSDGYVSPNGHVEFCATNKKLALATQELVISLGIKASLGIGRATLNGKDCGEKYRVCFYYENAARMPRKAINCRNGVRTPGQYIDFKYAGRGDTVCIEVDTPSHLFLAGYGMLPTCNSEIISKKFPAWVLGRDPKKQIVCSSYGSDLANDMGRKAKQVTQDNTYKNVFKDFKLADDKREGGNWETEESGGYYSVGVGGALTGRGFDIGIIDDPVKNREDAESEVMREKVWDWYTSTFFTRQQGSKSAIVILQTRWNVDDLSGRILEQAKQSGEKWKVLSYPAIDRDNNALCNREGYGVEFYEAQREAIGVRDFAALYQQDPIASTGQTFKKEDFRYYALSDLNKDDYTVAIHVDPAFSTRQDSDDTGIAVTARHKTTKEIYVLDVLAQPLLPSESYNYIMSLAEKWKDWTLEFISVEEATISKDQQDYLTGFENHMRENGAFHNLLLFKPRGKGRKNDRIKYSLEPMFNRHAIYFRDDMLANKDWMKLEEQLLKFPVSPHDDLMDAVSQGVIMWQEQRVDDYNDKEELDMLLQETDYED